jgi:alkylation response protein AidB-like acyl-CoA dehydrogenase
MRVRVELAQLMLYRFGWLRGQNRLALLESSILKLYVSESLMASGLDAMRIHGARGYIADFGVEREVRDALGGTLYGGTSDIHRSIIARLTGVASDA